MTQSHSEDDALLRILSVMASKGARGGEAVMSRVFFAPFQNDGWRTEDFIAGLELGLKKGLLELPQPAVIRLTGSGFAAIQGASQRFIDQLKAIAADGEEM